MRRIYTLFKTNRDTIPTLEIERFPQEGFLRDENFKSIDEKELRQRVSGFRSIPPEIRILLRILNIVFF